MTLKDYALCAFQLGVAIPVVIASLAAGFVFCHFILDRFNKTILGIHIRHWMTRNAPSKFFAEDTPDQKFVERVVLDTLRRADIKIGNLS